MKPKFEFFEVVVLLPCKPLPKRLWNTEGVIVGRAGEDSGPYQYGVQVLADNNYCWQLKEACLRSTGRFVKREDIYGGESITVLVDPVTGEGTIKK